jgi:arylsulfatase A-like enzyme
MPKPKPNIVFVVLDMMRAANTGYGGRNPSLTPNFDRMAREGRAFTRHFSTGCPTQIAFPGMFTSTLPLDHGGYNSGIKNRPVTFPEILNDAGYTTFGVTPAQAVSKYWGYGKGFDEFINLIDMVHWFRGTAITVFNETIREWADGDLSLNYSLQPLN